MAYKKKTDSSKTESKPSGKNLAGYKQEKKLKEWVQIGFADPSGPWLTTARRLRGAYNGRYNKNFARKNRFVVNTVFSVVQLLLPNLLFGPARVSVKPINAKYFKQMPDGQMLERDAVAAARIREAALNSKVRKIGMFDEQSKALLDAFFYGFGVCKAGYSYDTASELDTDYVVKDTCWNKRVDPRDFGWHPLATTMDDSCFFSHRLFMPKEKALLIPGINKKAIEEAKACVPKHIQDRLDIHNKNRSDSGSTDCTESYVDLIELHDEEQDKISLWSSDGKTMYKEATPDKYDFNGPHFTRIQLAGDNEVFEGIPLLSMIMDEALVLNELFTLMIEHVRKFPSQLFMNKGSMTENDMEQMRSGELGAIHTVDDINQIKAISPVSMGNDYYQLVRLIQDLVDRVLGIPDFQRGNSSGRRSATEASLIHGDATARRDYYLTLVKKFVLDGVKRVAWLQQQYQDQKEDIQASGELQGDPITYDKSDIQGDWAFDMDLRDLQASNETQLNTLINLYGVLAKSPDGAPVLASINPMKFGAALFKLGGMDIESYQWSPNDPNMEKVFSMVADKMIAQAQQAMGSAIPGGASPAQIPNAGIPGPGIPPEMVPPAVNEAMPG